ncbi:hypothetical protein C8F04DRAFT_894722, partial [Mycena alexandri]
MTLGVPYIQRVDGNPNHTVTVAVAHTSESLKRFGNGISERVSTLETELYRLAFGSNPNCPPEESITALYNLGLKRNDRSAKGTPGSTDGSYSLASTVEKGQGQGCFQPAVQAATPMAQALIGRTLSIVHELQQLILPCCLTAFEWAVWKFWAKDNNVFVFGGCGPGATGLQLNKSGIGALEAAIGFLQGKWHADISDAIALWTLGILLLKLPPGTLPTFTWISKDAIAAAYDMADPAARCFLVPYPTQVAYSRAAELAVSPPLTFGNLGAPVHHKIHSQNFSKDAPLLLGNDRDHFTRLGIELTWQYLNALTHANLELDIEAADLLRSLRYCDKDGQVHRIEPPHMHDIKHDAEHIMKMRGHVAWHFA